MLNMFSVWHALAVSQGLTSTVWLMSTASLTPVHGSSVFTAAISHCMAFLILFSVAVVEHARARTDFGALWESVRAMPFKLAFLGGLGFSATLLLVAAAPILGVALCQVLVVSGEVLTATQIDFCLGAQTRSAWTQLVAIIFVILGVALNIHGEWNVDTHVTITQLASSSFLVYFVGACLVINSTCSSHLREYVGASNATVVATFVSSCGNLLIWLGVELFGVAHFLADYHWSTCALWVTVGLCSSWNILVLTVVPKELGFSLTFCLITAGKLLGGLCADALGVVSRPRPITSMRLISVLAVFVGALFLKVDADTCFKKTAPDSGHDVGRRDNGVLPLDEPATELSTLRCL